jgi:hypothetical protein
MVSLVSAPRHRDLAGMVTSGRCSSNLAITALISKIRITVAEHTCTYSANTRYSNTARPSSLLFVIHHLHDWSLSPVVLASQHSCLVNLVRYLHLFFYVKTAASHKPSRRLLPTLDPSASRQRVVIIGVLSNAFRRRIRRWYVHRVVFGECALIFFDRASSSSGL